MVFVKPIKASESAFKPYPTASGTRLLYLATSHPDMGSPMRDPIGIASRTVPNSASLKPNAFLIVGILDAQVAKLKPEMKKKRLKKNLCLCLEIIDNLLNYLTGTSIKQLQRYDLYFKTDEKHLRQTLIP